MTKQEIQSMKLSAFLKLVEMVEDDVDLCRSLWRVRCETDMELFCSAVFDSGRKGILTSFISAHHEFFGQHLSVDRNKKALFLWPRGTAKSTIITRFATIHDIVYGREKYVLLFADTANQSREKTRTIRRDFESNQFLREVYGDMVGDPWKEDLLTFKNGCILRASSAGSEVRGFIEGDTRPTKVLLDDVENSAQVISPVYRQKRKDWFNEVIEFIGSNDMNVCIVGTVLHSDCLLADLEKRPDFNTCKRRAMISFPTNTRLWADWKKTYVDLANDHREQDARSFYETNKADMDAGSETLWPDNVKPKYPSKVYELMAVKATVGDGAFNKELQNEPVDPERQLFRMDEAERFSIKIINGVETVVRDNGEKIPIRALTIFGCHDPAGAPNKAGRSDFGAIGFVGRDRSARLYVLDVWLRRTPISSQITQAFEMYQRWNPIAFYVKETGTLGSLSDAYRRAKDDRKKAGQWAGMKPGFVTETENKIERIAHMEPHITNHWIVFNRDLPYECYDQFNQFPTHAHDDAPDVVHELWDHLKHGSLQGGLGSIVLAG